MKALEIGRADLVRGVMVTVLVVGPIVEARLASAGGNCNEVTNPSLGTGRAVLLGHATWKRNPIEMPYYQVSAIADGLGVIFAVWPSAWTSNGAIRSLTVRSWRDGQWGSGVRFSPEEPFHRYELHRVGAVVRLTTIANDQDVQGVIRFYDVISDAGGSGGAPRLSQHPKSITVDFTDQGNRIKRWSSCYRITSVLPEPSGQDSGYILGQYIEERRDYLLLFWGGGHMPRLPKICAWSYQHDAVRLLDQIDLGRGMYSMFSSYHRPVSCPSGSGRPVIALLKRDESVSMFTKHHKKSEVFLVRCIDPGWMPERVPVGESQIHDPEIVALKLVEDRYYILYTRWERGQVALELVCRERDSWTKPLTICWGSFAERAMQSDARGNIYIAWPSKRGIAYRRLVEGQLSGLQEIPAPGAIRTINIIPDADGVGIHFVWSSQKSTTSPEMSVWHQHEQIGASEPR